MGAPNNRLKQDIVLCTKRPLRVLLILGIIINLIATFFLLDFIDILQILDRKTFSLVSIILI